jgi:hypothetical protein
MSYAEILYEAADGIAQVTLNRPDKLNAWTLSMGAEVEHALRSADADPEVRVIVVTGAGKGYCAGADMDMLQELQRGGGTDGRFDDLAVAIDPELPAAFRGEYSYPLGLTKPVIAAVNGVAAGLGVSYMLYYDIRIASDRARFGFMFPRRGLIAEHGSAWILPRLVGMGHAMDLILTTDTVTKVAHGELRVRGESGELGVVRLFGVAKGSGMIHPNMATTLGYVCTDAAIAPEQLHALLREAIEPTFNAITVDGDTSTNDTVLALASGESGVEIRDRQALAQFGRKDEAINLMLHYTRLDALGFNAEVLFRPALRDVWRDPRSIAAAAHLGFLRYWEKSGRWPDFCAAPDLPYDCRKEAAKYRV